MTRETDNMAYPASGGKGFGKWFPFGKKKKVKQQSSTGSDDSDDDGYQDPATIHATEPPSFGRGPMPDYPPPRPNASPVPSPRGQPRPFSSIELGVSGKGSINPQGGRHASLANATNMHAKTIESRLPSRKDNAVDSKDEYFEPWDSKTTRTKPPVKPRPIFTQGNVDGQTTANNKDNYIEPWDTAKQASPVQALTLKDDYIDPWDSTNPSTSPKSSYEEDDDYTVPYDSGKTIPRVPVHQTSADVQDEIYDTPFDEDEQPKPSHPTANLNGDHQPPQPAAGDTYDEPWEWKQKIGKGKQVPPNRAPPPPPANQSRIKEKQSSLDPLPGQDNYDAPWDWKEKAAKDALAKRFSTNETADVETQRTNVSSPVNPIPKPARMSKDVSLVEDVVEHSIDPTVPLENQQWYHGNISRIEAESHLKCMPDCSYLIRNSESSKVDYSLSLKNNNSPMHLKISCRNGKFILGQHSRPYDSIPEMIHHYSRNNLNIRGAEQVKLIYPVLQESMYFTVEPGT